MAELPSNPDHTFRPGFFSTWSSLKTWPVVMLLSVLTASVLEIFQLPAALLLGPMLAAILLAVMGADIRPPKFMFLSAQSLIGVMIASTMPPTIFHKIAMQWPIFVVGVLSTAIAAATLGYFMVRSRIFPGTTALWGSAPGAASAMVVMSQSNGGDMRLVAFMQYIRVVCCAVAATTVAGFIGVRLQEASQIQWFPPLDVVHVGISLTVAFVSAWVGIKLRIPGAALLTPLAVALVLNASLGVTLAFPPWLMVLGYAALGWTVGGRFTPKVIKHAADNFFRVLTSVVCLIAVCTVFAAILVFVGGIDPLTAYLATTPGGADTVAIIASLTDVDVPFVMAMQVGRFLFIVITGPFVINILSRYATEQLRKEAELS